MAEVRLARETDLTSLLALFEACDVSAFASPPERAKQIWHATLANENVFVFVADVAGHVRATCMLITAPNLLRQGRAHGFLENVMTHPEYRGKGLGKAVVSRALEHAWAIPCHQVLLQSGRPDRRVHDFYESVGFMPGLRTAYAAPRPEDGVAGRGSERSPPK